VKEDGHMALVRVFTPDSEPELVTVVAMLEAHDIPCFVHNGALGGLYPGPQIEWFNMRSIMVAEEQVRAALELIREFESQPIEPGEPDPAPPPRSAARVLLEVLLFGWFIPSKSRPPRE
jgi:hypothetical protein